MWSGNPFTAPPCFRTILDSIISTIIFGKQKRSHNFCNSLTFFVGVAGFEPATPCSQSRCASRTALCPDAKPFLFVGVAGFEPATPCSQSRCASRTALCPDKLGGEGGIRTPGSLWDYDSLANCWFQPLTHLSVRRGFASAKVNIFFIHTTFFLFFFIFLL